MVLLDFVTENHDVSIAIAMEYGVDLLLEHGWTG